MNGSVMSLWVMVHLVGLWLLQRSSTEKFTFLVVLTALVTDTIRLDFATCTNST